MPEYPCRYVIGRFYRNLIRDEPRNFGIILQCPAQSYVNAKMDDDFERFSAFGPDQTILGRYKKKFEGLSPMDDSLFSGVVDEELDPQYLVHLSARSQGNIQFTEPRGCISEDPDKTLRELYDLLVASDEPVVALQNESAVEAEKETSGAQTDTFKSEFVRYVHKADPDNQRRVQRAIKITVEKDKIPFDCGYQRPGARGYVLFEAIDLSHGTIAQKIQTVGPTVLKFDMLTSHGPHNVSKNAIVKPMPPNGNGYHDSLELEQLRKSANHIYMFSDHTQMTQLLAGIKSDFENLKL